MSAPPTTAAFNVLAGLLKARSGLTIGQDKVYLLETRLTVMMRRENLADLNVLAERLGRPGSEPLVREMVEAMTTNESFFFRDDKPFQHFRTQALAEIARGPPAGQRAAHLVGRVIDRTGGLFAGHDPGGKQGACWATARLKSSAPTSRGSR